MQISKILMIVLSVVSFVASASDKGEDYAQHEKKIDSKLRIDENYFPNEVKKINNSNSQVEIKVDAYIRADDL